MATLKKSTGKKSKDPMSSVGVTHVSLSVRQVSGEVKKIRGICGHGLEQPLANYDPDTQSWKMYGDISLWGDCPLLVNLPVSGMTQNGVLFLQHPWVPITGETESLSWPTPRANVAMASLITPEIANNPNRQPNLETVVGRRLWPTPTTQEVEHPEAELTETGRRKSKNGNTSHSLGLADAVQMWPTPTAHPDNSNKNGKFKNPTLGDAVRDRETWPTPVVSDAWTHSLQSSQQTEGSRHSLNLPSAVGGQLNPTWVEWLMGFPSGWTDLED
jgi:DNA (cytosine-5)-methyltransferase 1